MKNFILGILTTIIVLSVLERTVLKSSREQKNLAKSKVSPIFKNGITRSKSHESYFIKNTIVEDLYNFQNQ